MTARKLVNGGSHRLNSFRTAYVRSQEVYCDDLRLVGWVRGRLAPDPRQGLTGRPPPSTVRKESWASRRRI